LKHLIIKESKSKLYKCTNQKNTVMNHFQKNKNKLEKLRGIFLQLGLIVAGIISLLAFEWKSPYQIATLPNPDLIYDGTTEFPPITIQDDKSKKERPKIKIEKTTLKSDQFKVVDNNVKVDDNKEKKKEKVVVPEFNPDKWKTIDKVVEPSLPLYFAQNMPFYIDCEDLNEYERKVCTQNKMYAHFAEKTHIPDEIKIRGKADYIAYVYFEVSKEGVIENVEIKNDKKHSIPKVLERQAYNAVSTLPNMMPGKNHGKTVAVRYSVPIHFSVGE